MKHWERRRRGVFIPPVLILLLALAAALPAGYLLLRSAGSGPAGMVSATPAPGGDRPGEHALTASGIPCTLTQLEEGAVHTGDLLLVNNQILYHFPEEQLLTSIYEGKTGSYYVRDKEVYIAPPALEALNRMLDDFRAQGGSKTVNVVAGYRTEAFQQHLFDQSVARNGREHAEEFVAQPGGSEHHTGLVVDFSLFYEDGTSAEYQGTGEYAWINGNCQNYGWVVRYKKAKEPLTGIGDEPWHFRYVGVPHAAVMTEKGLCLEEYTDYLKEFPFDGQHLAVDWGGERFEIWYCAGTAAYLPDSGDYTVSGNNVDGVVVTCKIG